MLKKGDPSFINFINAVFLKNTLVGTGIKSDLRNVKRLFGFLPEAINILDFNDCIEHFIN